MPGHDRRPPRLAPSRRSEWNRSASVVFPRKCPSSTVSQPLDGYIPLNPPIGKCMDPVLCPRESCRRVSTDPDETPGGARPPELPWVRWVSVQRAPVRVDWVPPGKKGIGGHVVVCEEVDSDTSGTVSRTDRNRGSWVTQDVPSVPSRVPWVRPRLGIPGHGRTAQSSPTFRSRPLRT